MKKWLEPFSSAWVGIATHKLRSILTMLGIVIGVAAVIALMSIGRGATASILSNIESIGSDLITISPGSVSFGGVRSSGGSAVTLTMQDAEAIYEQIPNISMVAPYYSSSLQVIAGSENVNAQIYGVTPEYNDVQNLEIISGSFFTEADYDRGSKFTVIGSNVAETLFGTADPIGQQMRMGTIIVRVTGVLAPNEGFMSNTDNAVYIPLSAMRQTVAQPRTSRGEEIVSSITLTVTDPEQATATKEAITALLRTRHNLAAGTDDDFRITSIEEIASTVSEVTGTMTLFLGAIAAISLLVGGIGVMNIMLVSVLERTREIGIRKALGAREQDIWGQFLIEAALLSLGGGILGVIIGWAITYFVNLSGVVPAVVSADIVLLAVSVSVGIGVFFGFYPAWNAARLNPIDALRSE
ncbi:ABC transporter permease [Chloroflexota bacterium]